MAWEAVWRPLHWEPGWERRIRGGMLGLAVGDSFGLPWEMLPREEIAAHLTGEMVGGGTWGKPPGTWSDDTAQALAMADSLAERGLDLLDYGRRLLAWYERGEYTPDGDVFDIGYTTRLALLKIASGEPVEDWGVARASCGSLMRNLPIAIYTLCLPLEEALHWTHEYSRVTHSHPESMMAAGLHTVVVRAIFSGMSKTEAIRAAGEALEKYYSRDPHFARHARHFSYLKTLPIPEPEEANCRASKMLRAALWAFQEGADYRDTVIKAVSLGNDTDTVGAIAGGLAGAYYGPESIPQEWLQTLRGRPLLEEITEKLIITVRKKCRRK